MTISARDAQWFPQHQQIKEILRMGYNHHNHHNWWQLVTLVMMVQEYRRSNHNAISVITRHRQTRNSPWSSRLATISYLILTSHNVDAKFSVHPIALHVIQTLICISRSIHRWYIYKECNIVESELRSIQLWYNSMTPQDRRYFRIKQCPIRIFQACYGSETQWEKSALYFKSQPHSNRCHGNSHDHDHEESKHPSPYSSFAIMAAHCENF